MVPENLKYTKEHEWIKVDGDEAVIGITDHAQSELGDITFVDLPQEGNDIVKSASIATVESVKAASDVYSPLSGKIAGVNDALEAEPEKMNQSPYEDGWICRISMTDAGELDGLMDASAYEEFLKES
jgi:glycine cleavage system H protein